MDQESNPFKPAALDRPDVLHDQQMLRDLAVANARTTQEVGALPVGGLTVMAKRKPNLPRPVAPTATMSHEHEETDMNLKQIVATAVLAAGVAACESSERTVAATDTEVTSSQRGAHTRSTSGTVAPVSQEQPSETLSQASSTHPQSSSGDNLKAFIPEGATILAAQAGDLNRDGRMDAMIVADPAHGGNEMLGEGPARTVILLIRDIGGQLTKMAENDKIVPCSKCGGMLGDPFGYIRIDKDDFTVLIEGGSRQRWSSTYKFQYSAQSNDWYLYKVERGAYDTISEESISKIFTQKEFGRIAFSDFNPSKIPEVILP